MFKHYTGTSIRELADRLFEELDTEGKSKVLAPEVFVVQNHGMARWLSLQMAEREGVAANLEFEFPAERIWKLIRAIHPEISQSLPSDRQAMRWALAELLQQNNEGKLEPLNRYMRAGDFGREELRRWQLAGRIADIFDQYLTYRPQMLLHWEQGKKTGNFASETWQSMLWRKLVNRWKGLSKESFTHRAVLQQDLLETIDKRRIDKDLLPERITVFGVSTMPPVYLKILVKLAHLTDVLFYGISLDCEKDPLVSSFGKTSQDFYALLDSFIRQETDLDVEHIQPESSGNVSFNWLRGQDTTAPEIHIANCPSPRREVEVLYNRLLHLLDSDPELQPSDIMVLVPDFETYASEIEAVFGTVEKGLPEIPFYMAEYPAAKQPVVQAFSALLELTESRYKVTDILEFLSFEPVRRKFDLTEDKLDTLERWVDENRIRWGIDGTFKATLNVPATDGYTWKSGLNRMILGYAMQPEADKLYQAVYPYKEINSVEDAALAGRFSSVMHRLFEIHRQVQTPRSLAGWGSLIGGWIDLFFEEGEHDVRDIQLIRQTLADLDEQQSLSGSVSKVPFRLIRLYLEEELSNRPKGGGRSGRGVAFGSLVSMRSIPAKVIAMLGMNDGLFPRSEISSDFDLMALDPQPGDRSHSREDRQLFLEALTAAKQGVYISYTGQSNRQDTEFPPSVVVRELTDYLQDHFSVSKEQLYQNHPLQAFSKRYYRPDENPSLWSYSKLNKEIAAHISASPGSGTLFMDQPLPDPDASFKSISLSDLISYFQHPARFFLRNRLGINFHAQEVADENREPFVMNALENYQLGQELFEQYISSATLDGYRKVVKAKNLIPEDWPGEQAFNKQKKEVIEFAEAIQELIQDPLPEPPELHLSIDDFVLTGRLKSVYKDHQLHFRFGRAWAKDRIACWLRHLALQLIKPTAHPGNTLLCSRGGKQEADILILSPLPPSDSRTLLKGLLQMYWSGLCGKDIMYPETSYRYAEALLQDGKEENKADNAARKKWEDDYSEYPKEGDDAYNRKLSDGYNPLDNNVFKDNALSFWKPFFEAVNREEV